MELIDAVAAKFHEEPGVFKLLVTYPELCGARFCLLCLSI